MIRVGLDSPVGRFWVEVRDGAVTRSGWGPADDGAGTEDPVACRALAELRAYFAGGNAGFAVPLRPGASASTMRVLDAMRAIPHGETRTYGDLSRDLGLPPQAVGRACGANPIPVLIPCHRVLGAGGLGGFSAPGGVETKVALLKHEGAYSLLL